MSEIQARIPSQEFNLSLLLLIAHFKLFVPFLSLLSILSLLLEFIEPQCDDLLELVEPHCDVIRPSCRGVMCGLLSNAPTTAAIICADLAELSKASAFNV